MKRLALASAVAITAVVGVALYPSTERQTHATTNAQDAGYSLDVVHSGIFFRIRHMGVSNFIGRFNEFDGSFDLDWDTPEDSSMNITVQSDSVDTGNERRDGHLRSNDFFTVKQFPEIAFEADEFRRKGDGVMQVTGDLTYHGVTNQVTADLELVDMGDTRQGYKMGVDGTFTIKRSDFGDTKYIEQNALGDEVTLMVHLAGVRGGE